MAFLQRTAPFRLLVLVAILGTLLNQSCRTLPVSAPKELAEATYSLHLNLDESFSHTIALMEERNYLRLTDTFISRANYSDTISRKLSLQFDKRLRYINVLNAYFNALAALAEKNNTSEVHDAACKLNNALTGLKEKVPSSEQGFYKATSLGFSVITDLIIRSISQNIQRKTIKLAMDTAGPSLDTICKLLIADLKIADMAATNNGNSVIQRLIITRNSDSSLTNRVAWDKNIHDRMKEMNNLHNSYQCAIALLQSLPSAHAQARKTLDKKIEFRDAISYVSSQGSELGALYSKIKSSQ